MKGKREVYRNITLILQFGINMLVPILLCTFLGIFLDRIFKTSFIVIILFFLGAAAGFRNIFVIALKGSDRTSYLGTDGKNRIDDMAAGRDGDNREDWTEKIDRAYRENKDEQA